MLWLSSAQVKDLDRGLSALQQGESAAFTALVERSLAPATAYFTFLDPQVYISALTPLTSPFRSIRHEGPFGLSAKASEQRQSRLLAEPQQELRSSETLQSARFVEGRGTLPRRSVCQWQHSCLLASLV